MTKGRILIGGLIIMLASLFVLSAVGQQPTTTQAGLATGSQQTKTTQPAQIQPETGIRDDYSFVSALKENPTLGTHQSVTGAHYESVTFSDPGEAVFLAEFFDNRVGPVRGIFKTGGQAIAEDGEKVGDITVRNIRTTEPFDIQTNRQGEVSWVALIEAKECGTAATCIGLFQGKKLVAVTNSAIAPGAYSLGDDEKITMPLGHNWLTPAAGAAAASAPDAKKPGWLQRHLAAAITLPSINLGRGVILKPGGCGPTWQQGPNGPVQVGGCAPTQPGQVAQQRQPGQPVQEKAPFGVLAQLPYCPTPVAVWPNSWNGGANAAGPIGSARTEGTPGSFVSLLHPQVRQWRRKLFFATDCRAILAAAIESPGIGALELVTPVGVVASFDSADGVYRINGVPPVSLPPASNPIEDGARINRKCQVMLSVSFKRATGDESAIIIGTPTKPGHCPLY
jgi:hypothetical protein